MKLSPAAILAVDRVRYFLKWHADRFDDLSKPEPLAGAVGWRRKEDFWVRPDIWRDTIFDGDEEAAVEAARTLRSLDLLGTQKNSPNVLQAVVEIRGKKSARAYVVRPGILEWEPTTPAYKTYAAQAALPDIAKTEPPALISCTADGSPPSDLASKLELAVNEALDETLAILRLRPETDDRAYQAILRAKTTIVNSVLSTQVRVDEGRLKQQRQDQVLAQLGKLIEQFRTAETPSSIEAT